MQVRKHNQYLVNGSQHCLYANNKNKLFYNVDPSNQKFAISAIFHKKTLALANHISQFGKLILALKAGLCTISKSTMSFQKTIA